MQVLLSNSQAGPSRTVKQETEEISWNHILADLGRGKETMFASSFSLENTKPPLLPREWELEKGKVPWPVRTRRNPGDHIQFFIGLKRTINQSNELKVKNSLLDRCPPILRNGDIGKNFSKSNGRGRTKRSRTYAWWRKDRLSDSSSYLVKTTLTWLVTLRFLNQILRWNYKWSCREFGKTFSPRLHELEYSTQWPERNRATFESYLCRFPYLSSIEKEGWEIIQSHNSPTHITFCYHLYFGSE